MSKRNKNLSLSIACLLSGMLYFLAMGAAKAELAPGSIQFDKNSSQKAFDYLLSQPVVKGPFTGEKQADMEEVYPFQVEPFSRYVIEVESPSKKQTYQGGEELNLNGKISYSINTSGFQKAVDENKNCDTCPVAEKYHVSALSNVGVFVQIWRKDGNKITALKGDHLVDEFYAAEGINLSEDSMRDFTVKWTVPAELKSGDYYFFFFANAEKRFTLAGSPLLPFYQAASYNFKIKNDKNDNGVELDKDNITINGSSYVYRQPAPEVTPKDGKITINLPLANLNTGNQTVSIKYNLYGWGQEDPMDLINTKQEEQKIDSEGKINLEYAFEPDQTGSVYDLEIKASTPQSVSTANIRFVVKDANRGVIRFLGQSENSQGQKLPMFCVRNAAWNQLFSGKVKITSLDAQDQTLNTFEKIGIMKAEDHCFVIKSPAWLASGKAVKLQGEIYDNNGRLVDKKSASLYSEKARETSTQETGSGLVNNLPINKLQVALLVILLVLLGTGGYLISIRSKKEE